VYKDNVLKKFKDYLRAHRPHSAGTLLGTFFILLLSIYLAFTRQQLANLITNRNVLEATRQDILTKIAEKPAHYAGDNTSNFIETRAQVKQVGDIILQENAKTEKLLSNPLAKLLPPYQKKYQALKDLETQGYKTILAYENYYKEAFDNNKPDENKLTILNNQIEIEKAKEDEKYNISAEIGLSPTVIVAIVKTPIVMAGLIIISILELFFLLSAGLLLFLRVREKKYPSAIIWLVVVLANIASICLFTYSLLKSFY
jgi:hypothetical protein